MKFVLATGNLNKVREMQSVLSALGIEAVPQGELGLAIEPEETDSTFRKNALIKASAVCNASGLPAIADDSGLMVDALGGAPGVYSKRFGGGLDDAGLCTYLLKKMENTEQRGAKFVSSIVCVFSNADIISAEGECHGEILHEPRGDGGFGYDSVFMVTGTNKSMAELTQDEKNTVSHRGNALRAFAIELRQYLDEGNFLEC